MVLGGSKPNRETGVKIKAPGQRENNPVINVSVWMQHGANSVPRTKRQGQQKQFEAPSAGELHRANIAAGQEMLSVRSCPVLGQCPSGSRLSFPSLPSLFRHQPCGCHRFGSVAVIKNTLADKQLWEKGVLLAHNSKIVLYHNNDTSYSVSFRIVTVAGA